MSQVAQAVANSSVESPAFRPISLPNTAQKSPQYLQKMYCDVVFGSPSMDCNGTGICKINSAHSRQAVLPKKDCTHTSGVIASNPGGQISLYFFRKFLCIHLYRQHFRKGVFVLNEPCPVPEEITKGLNIKGQVLLPGQYKVHTSDGFFRVDLAYA